MLTAQDPSTGNYRIPKIIHSDAYFSETVAYADLVLPDTTYLERWDCMSLLDQPISSPNEFADAIRQPVIEIKDDVRPFQDVLLSWAHASDYLALLMMTERPNTQMGIRIIS